MITSYPHIQPPPEFQAVNLIDYALIQDLDEFRQVVANAEIIIACDKNRSGIRFVYHSEVLRDIAAKVQAAREMVVVGFAVDFRTQLVHQLCASVLVVKGSYQWGREAAPPAPIGVDTFEGNSRCLPPHEGLTAAINVLRLELDYIQRRLQNPIDCSRPTAIRLVTNLIVLLTDLKNRVLNYSNDDLRFSRQPQSKVPVMRKKPRDAKTIQETRLHVMQQDRAIKVPVAGIDYPGGRFLFTHETYIQFIFDSLTATEQLIVTGKFADETRFMNAPGDLPRIVISGATGLITSGMEHLERIAKTGKSESLRMVFGEDASTSYECIALIDTARAGELQNLRKK